jgi:hypothetical protein
MSFMFKNDARSFARRITMWYSVKNCWHDSEWSSISFWHWQCPWDGDFSFTRFVRLLTLSLWCYYWFMYIHTYIPLMLYPQSGSRGNLRYYSESPTFYQNYLAMSNTADVTGGKPIDVWSQSISGVNAINPLVALRHPWKKERGAILLFCPGHHTRRMYPK